MNEAFFVFQLIVLIFSVIIHEISHGYVAEYLGDPTARIAGRLTLNPAKHLDLFGSFIVPLFLLLANQPVIGWAKPVPYNPYNLNDPQKGGGLIALAGPASNLLVAFILGLCIRFLGVFPILNSLQTELLVTMFGLIVVLNVTLALFNLLPIPPFDGSKVLALILPRKAQLHLDAFWARAWLIIQERWIIFLIIIFVAAQYIINFIFFFLEPLIKSFVFLFTGISI
ncbi:MAG: site-2 protease family protein [Patescibacteria group bacterium]